MITFLPLFFFCRPSHSALTLQFILRDSIYSVYQRFDNFNSKYSPFRMAQMRKIFLKTDNHIEGRFFAELTKIVLARHEQGKGHRSGAEMRLSIYGMERKEWLQLAKWVLRDWQTKDFPGNMLSSHNRWLVQVPRLWRVYYKKGKGTVSFQDMLENLFGPLFEATLFPEEHPEVAELLNHIVGFDSVDDEGSLEVGIKFESLTCFGFVLDLLLTSTRFKLILYCNSGSSIMLPTLCMETRRQSCILLAGKSSMYCYCKLHLTRQSNAHKFLRLLYHHHHTALLSLGKH